MLTWRTRLEIDQVRIDKRLRFAREEKQVQRRSRDVVEYPWQYLREPQHSPDSTPPFPIFLPAYHLESMSSQTAADVARKMTEYDVLVRKAVQEGNVDTVMERKGAEIVSE